MDTWAIQAAVHATLTSGISLGSAPEMAETGRDTAGPPGTVAAELAAAPEIAEPGRRDQSRLRRRVNAMLTQMLGDDADEEPATAGKAAGRAGPVRAGPHRSRHRMPGPVGELPACEHPSSYEHPYRTGQPPAREQSRDDEFLPAEAKPQDEPQDDEPQDDSPGNDQARHRRQPPRHAAPSGGFTARLTSARLPGTARTADKSSRATW